MDDAVKVPMRHGYTSSPASERHRDGQSRPCHACFVGDCESISVASLVHLVTYLILSGPDTDTVDYIPHIEIRMVSPNCVYVLWITQNKRAMVANAHLPHIATILKVTDPNLS